MVKFNEDDIKRWVVEFFARADASTPVSWFLPFVDDKFHMFWTPDCQFDGPEGFCEFYRNTTHNMFNRVHEVRDVAIKLSGDTGEVNFRIHETLNVWNPPAPRSLDATIDATFKWAIRKSAQGAPVIVDYTLTSVSFPKDSVVVEAAKAFKDPPVLRGPFSMP